MNFGMIVEQKLKELDRKKAWLSRELGKPSTTITSWSKGASPALDTAMEVIRILTFSKSEENLLLRLVFDNLKGE
tara:strand:- start:8851 stop:9075 length:225 start_codon:yes stop_codon:yes gene_type:complete